MGDEKVLIVDDDPAVLETLSAVLDEFQVTAAHSVREATSRILNVAYEVVVVDYELEDGTGELVLKTLREQHGGRSAGILLTGHADSPEVRRLQRSGEVLVLFKPVNPEELLSWVRNEVSMVRIRRSIQGMETRRTGTQPFRRGEVAGGEL